MAALYLFPIVSRLTSRVTFTTYILPFTFTSSSCKLYQSLLKFISSHSISSIMESNQLSTQDFIPNGTNTKPKKKYSKILRRIIDVETYFTELTTVLGSYASKGNIVKEKNDELAKCFAKYAKVEELSTTSKLAMQLATELMVKVGNEQMTAIERLEKSVVPNFSSYAKLSKCLRKDVNKAMAAYEKEEAKRKLVKTFSEKLSAPKYHDVLKDAQRELENARAEALQLGLHSQDQVIKFEHKRLTDLKEGMESFFRIEISKHAKSLELLTEAYKYIHSIDEHGDMEAIQQELQLKEISVGSKTGADKCSKGSFNKYGRVENNTDGFTETSDDERSSKADISKANSSSHRHTRESRDSNKRRK